MSCSLNKTRVDLGNGCVKVPRARLVRGGKGGVFVPTPGGGGDLLGGPRAAAVSVLCPFAPLNPASVAIGGEEKAAISLCSVS